ncbi:MAG: CapA family protein [Bacteroidales bacterium]|nr:CapA family protein [Bacteroidales bacterium]
MAIALLLSTLASAQRLPGRNDRFPGVEVVRRPLGDIDFEMLRKPDTVTVFVLGDLMCHGKMMRSAHAIYSRTHSGASIDNPYHFDFSTFFCRLGDRISGADVAVGNLEFPFAGPPFSGYPSFSTPDCYAEYAANEGFDVILTANNHVLDQGTPGLKRTLDVYDKMEASTSARYTGTARSVQDELERYPLIVNVRNVRLAFVNFTYGTNSGASSAWPKVEKIHRDEILAAIERAREKEADVIIAIPHWGEEYQLRHNAAQEDLARWLVANGVDVIVGSHPHVVQDIAVYQSEYEDGSPKEVPVVYSLGNAVSNQNDLPARLEGCVTLRIVSHRGKTRVLPDPCLEFLWCTKAGMIDDGYSVVPVEEYAGHPEVWKVAGDYEKMMSTYDSVRKRLGLK